MANILIDPISQDPIRNIVEITSCGHAFDAGSLMLLILSQRDHYRSTASYECPMCRNRFSIMELYQSRSLQTLIDQGRTSTASTQTEVEVPPALPEPVFRVGNATPFRIVINENGEMNPDSKHFPDGDSIVQGYNANFPRGELAIEKYVYQSNSQDIKEVARSLARTGYYVYDLFPVKRSTFSNPITTYCAYLHPYNISGGVVHFSRYRRQSPVPELISLD